MTAPVLSAGTWANNAELIRDAVVPLGICIDCGHAERTTNDQQRTA